MEGDRETNEDKKRPKVSSTKHNYNYWGGTPKGLELGVLLTDQSNKLLAPQ